LNVIHLIIHGRILAKKNSRLPYMNKGRVLNTAKYHDWEKDACLQLLQYKGRNLDNIELQFEFYMPDNRRTDLDNKISTLLDILAGKMHVIKDDAWQNTPKYSVEAKGIDRKNPRVEIWIRYD